MCLMLSNKFLSRFSSPNCKRRKNIYMNTWDFVSFSRKCANTLSFTFHYLRCSFYSGQSSRQRELRILMQMLSKCFLSSFFLVGCIVGICDEIEFVGWTKKNCARWTHTKEKAHKSSATHIQKERETETEDIGFECPWQKLRNYDALIRFHYSFN